MSCKAEELLRLFLKIEKIYFDYSVLLSLLT